MGRRFAVVALLGVGALSETAVAAEPVKRVTLRYSAPEACPDDAQLIATVEGFLGQQLRETREQELSASVNVVGGGNGFAAKLTFTSPRGTDERFVEDAECGKLTEAVAMLVAIAIDPERVHANQAAAEAPAPAAEPAPPAAERRPEPAPPAPATPCPPPPPLPKPPERYAFAGISAFAGTGILPGISPGISADLGARFGSFRAAVVGSYWLGATAERASDAPISIDLSLSTAGVRLCGERPTGSWLLLGCAQGDLGQMSGSGQNVDDARTQQALFGSLQALAFAQYSEWQPAPQLGFGLSWNLARPPFGISRQNVPTETFRPSQLAFLAYLGVAVGP
jgi:hypothetical protein